MSLCVMLKSIHYILYGSLNIYNVLFLLQLILNLWGDELNSRSPEVKQSLKGKVVSATHMQTVSYVKPLFRKLKRQVFAG